MTGTTSNWYLMTLAYKKKMWDPKASNFYKKDLYYNSKTQYIAYKGKFWTR